MYVGHLFKGEIGSPECIHAVLFETSLINTHKLDWSWSKFVYRLLNMYWKKKKLKICNFCCF